jgi:chitodextrinase
VIQSGPSGTATSDTVTFTWTGNDDGTPSGGLVYSYQLERFDTAPTGFGPATIKTYTGLTDGATYTFSVQARDAAGNVDAIAARRTFRGGRTPAPRRRSPRRWC